jgi:hypothetical protein
MKTKEIPKTEWPKFFDSFTRKHEGWLVNLEIFGSEIGAQVAENQLTLEGITDESDDMEGNTIIITMGAKPNDHITHSIKCPTAVSLEQTDEGADMALAIKGEDGATALLRFRSAVMPEMVDAIAT